MFSKKFVAHWPMTALPASAREQLAEQLRESFSEGGPLHIPSCCGTAPGEDREPQAEEDEEDFPYLGRCHSPLLLERCKSPGMVALGEKLMADNTSVGTTSTLEESIVSSGHNSCASSVIVVRRLGRMEVPKKSSSRKRRPRRRVCLLEGCRCPYHEPTGPIDVDSLCEELSKSTHGSRINIDVNPFQEANRTTMHEKKPVTVTRRDDSESSSTPNEHTTTIRSCAQHNNSLGEESFAVPRFLDDPADLCSTSAEASWSDFDEIVLDETDMSRGLVGYQEGCEPEVIAKFSDSDVQRWELEDLEKQEQQANDNTIDLLSCPSHHSKEKPRHSPHEQSPATHHSRGGSSSRQSSRASRHSKTTVCSSTTYPTTIPASAAEV